MSQFWAPLVARLNGSGRLLAFILGAVAQSSGVDRARPLGGFNGFRTHTAAQGYQPESA